MIKSFRGCYAFLSNFYTLKNFTFEGIPYKNAEAAFQSMKCINPEDRIRFSDLIGSEARVLGRTVSLRPDWEHIKDDIMYRVVKTKFSDSNLKQRLLDTGDEELVEDNWWSETYWGVCAGVGLNKLGKILMRVRQELREEENIVSDR